MNGDRAKVAVPAGAENGHAATAGGNGNGNGHGDPHTE
jgi:hypothetical protein